MNLTVVADLLRERIGLDPASLGATSLTRAVWGRMAALGLTRPAEYAVRLTNDAREFQTLLGEVTVPETWFFRGGDLFAHLASRVVESARARLPGSRYRILSVPCSTGEEPYSLAIALAEAGAPASAYVIEAIDVNPAYLERARLARFNDLSFRQTAPELRRRYFRPVDAGWELVPAIRSLVRFREDNLLAPNFLAGEEGYDLIFCRNLFIYLHEGARRRALDTLYRLLAPSGLLSAGHAEPLDRFDARFARTGASGYFLFHRKTAGRKDEPEAASAPLPSEPAEPATAAVELLVRARRQADAGKLDEALATCESSLRLFDPSADLFGLMGVLYQAIRKKEEAVRCFQRALYLEPGHRDALTHWMLLCKEQGDLAQGALLCDRLERLSAGGET